MQKTKFDIVIVGAGIAGALLANLLAKQTELNIALIDMKAPDPNWQPDSDASRVSAINATVVKVLQYLNCWQAIAEKRVSPYQKMKVWDDASIGEIVFDCAELQLPLLGHIVENNLIQQTLLDRLANQSNVTTLWPVTLTALEVQSRGAILEMASGDCLQAKLVIGADGANSWVRGQAAVTVKEAPYHHTAIVSTIKTSKPHQQTAWQSFLDTGPLAFLPLQEAHTSSIVWSCEPEKANYLMTLSDADFAAALARDFRYRLGEVIGVSRRFSFPLTMRHVERYCADRVALVGDAAHTIHPLAGQGLNLAVMDVICLADQISTACQKGRDFSTQSVLRRYARRRKAENTVMVKAMGGFKRLFASKITPIVLMRSRGLRLINHLDFIKPVFVRHAMGLADDLPEFLSVRY